jgi:hypothetical protein
VSRESFKRELQERASRERERESFKRELQERASRERERKEYFLLPVLIFHTASWIPSSSFLIILIWNQYPTLSSI